jgi:hypothetical protein
MRKARVMEACNQIVWNVLRTWLITSILITIVATAARAADSTTVPIRLEGVHIYVDVSINGKPASFVLDTGASANVITPDAVRRLTLMPGPDQTPLTGAAGKAGSVSDVQIAALDVGTAHLKDLIAYVIPLPEALPCDGLLGTQFVQSQIVTIDYERLTLTLTPRRGFRAPAGATAVPLQFIGNTPFLEAYADGHKGWFRMDTGAGNAATLFAKFVERNNMAGKYTPSIRLVTGRGVGGLLYGDLVRLPTLQIGPYKFANGVTEFSRQTEGTFGDPNNAGNLGGEIWQRFTVTLDYAGKRAYLKPNGQFDKPFIAPRSGLALDTEKGINIVRDVMPNSPASEAGIQVGDVVTAIDGKPIEQIKHADVTAALRRDPGTKVVLRVRSGTTPERNVTVTLRDLL